MDKDLRAKHIDFIENDTKKRGETIVSEITFFASLYQCKVKLHGTNITKKVNYSAAVNVLKGFRKIEVA